MDNGAFIDKIPIKPDVFLYRLKDDGQFPNNKDLPLLVYKNTVDNTKNIDPEHIEAILRRNGWAGGWRNGVYDFHHYHSTAHECLFVYSGRAHVQFGGEHGVDLEITPGDTVILPAGTAHKRLVSTLNFKVIGVYPSGQTWDMNYGKKGERPKADENIKDVSLPDKDPLYGENGPLVKYWREGR